ncbi:hypothetical protein A2690_02595 [Candidatus Roizmanbacteria bacterium RIFCSPHIGHO2_01_FULL_39_12b]|uniref:Solute-binding protein family 5 domain-containing protein n=1 Tax=Candidatus Roizmanbacteria bacterium RIFCSPHIGHO2_01_FULL_39_12b TaxID=1802030 RepID=A0A1F7GCJ0_9BACT|nr:MAG: hypothetical protein A2690_02595 [Candidatus Roizmanbacteria bacterium RIFCSPHIGHO2_01_FULL_39_12b]OGK46767.1 MAG: hypothetical protein A3B46_02415 [Candidatus Roizmanbacteria bacterium RIFCSPLOWO2_01_FULL_39_19]
MTQLIRRVRTIWWYSASFLQKNAKFILTSFVAGFIMIFFFLSIYPSINSYLFRKKEKIGLIARVKLGSLPKIIISQISTPLVTITPQGEIVPVLANSWEIMPDKKTFRFHIKNGLKWSDGKEFKARDIKLQFSEGVKINVVDDLTIEFILDQSLEVFPVYLTQPVIRNNTQGVGGPYKMQGYTKKRGFITSINLFPNRDKFPYKVYRFYTTANELSLAYKSGEINEFETLDRSVVDSFAAWRNTKIKRVVDYSQIMTLFFNMKSELFKERDARKAVTYSIKSFDEYGVPAVGSIPPISWAHMNDVKQYGYNLNKATEGADKILSSTEEAKIKLYTFLDYAGIAEKIKTDLKKVRFDVSLKLVSFIPDEFDMFLTIWDVPQDPDQYIFWHSKQTVTNITHYNNAKIDKLLEDGREVVNVQQRKKIYRDFQKVIVDDLPAYFMYYPYVYTIKRK